MFGLQGPEAYAYTSLSNCLDVSDIDDRKDYSDTIVRPKLCQACRSAHILPESYANNRTQCSGAVRDISYACHRPMVGERTICGER